MAQETYETWEAVGGSITHLTEESKLLPLVVEKRAFGRVLALLLVPSVILIAFQVTGVAPWVTRIAEVTAALAINIEAERKVTSLSNEVQGVVRTLRAKGQNTQDATVKIERMERHIETIKKQGDTIVDLEQGQEAGESLRSSN